MEDCIMNEEISVALLAQVKEYKNEISFIFSSLHLPNRNTHDREKWQSICVAKINKLVETEKNVRGKLTLLENALKFAEKVLTGTGYFATEILGRKENLRTMKMKELNEDFWGPHMALLEKLDSLQVVMESVSFMNITKIYLQESDALRYVTSDDKKHDMDNLLHLFEVLSTEGIRRFEAEWNQVLLSPDSQTVKGVKALLADVTSDDLDNELSVLKGYFMEKFSLNVKLYLQDCVMFSHILDQVKHVISLMEAFEILNPERSNLVLTMTTFLETFEGDDEVVVANLHEPMRRIEEIIFKYEINETIEVIMELGKGPELVNFLKEIVDEDIRVLIDAVEEHSDQSVSVSLVSDFIQVHGFIATVIKKCNFAPDLVLTTLVDESKKQPMMSTKIRQCRLYVHSLKALYQNVANREEMTRDIIMNCLNNGVFDIVLDKNGMCQITVSYNKDGDNSVIKKSMSELHDLRSRAHLIISSSDVHKREINFADFIEQVNILSEIEEAIIRLQSSGYIKYQNAHHWSTMKTKHLEQLNKTLREELGMWEESLRKARQQHYYLNYYWSNQLCVLYNFLTNPDRTKVDFENVITLIHFVDPTIDEELVHDYGKKHNKNLPDTPQDAPDEIMSIIGKGLGDIFMNTRLYLPDVLGDVLCKPVECSTSSVKKGKLYVAVLEEKSVLTVNVMMSLYKNTTKGYPESYQVIFCGPHITWEELQIFLHRCFTQKNLFCLANVELLTNEVQFEVVDFIKKQDTEDSNLYYQLAIICRGGDHHHIVEEFSKFSDHTLGMSYSDISKRFKTAWPDVKFVTSTLPGLGKTEFVRQDAVDKGMNVVTFPISGQINQSKIIERLKQLDFKDFQCLHFDIGEVDDPVLLDTFLFQLIVTGMVSFGTQLYRLPKTHVYIEIANSLNDQLRESLAITKCFTRVQLQWSNYDNLEVSSKITSDIQVVCQYLHALERGRLETIDIHFSGRQEIKPLSANRCRELLLKYYSTNSGTTFTALNTFLGLLAGQLRKFSRSTFFTIENLKLMLEDKAFGVRSNLLTALLDVSKDFAARSLKTCSSSNHQEIPSATSAQHMVQRVEGMIQWEESNHLLIVFHGLDSQTIAAFYRDKDRVPQNVSDLLKSQIVKGRNKELDDFKKMSHEELHGKLERIARCHPAVKNQDKTEGKVFSSYALTPDNMLKMILIILRVRANVPIIIMGETGCGKTSLVEYLANLCQIPFLVYNFHAGRTEEEVEQFIQVEDDEARKVSRQRWVFLDEINTCHHLGLISEIMCRRTLYGRPLSKKLVFLAACNPYKLRQQENATTAGLKGKNKNDPYSDLVYRVHPLPEAMVDYVWDYGSLTPQDEKVYILRMVQNLPSEYQHVLVELLANSQAFIRESEDPYSVSLRDVHRCIVLVKWFMDTISKRADLMMKRKRPLVFEQHLESYQNLSRSCKLVVKSIVLALAHCYLSRLQTEELREEYINSMTNLIPSMSKETFSAIIRMEQEDYLQRMELPPGTAKNTALRENVFVMLVSILNRIPVFVVGKPGCSKSLAIQLIRSNLRGKDSQDPFFKTLPHLYVVSYQGSESSTSEGINEIFKMASSYKDHNKDADVLPVVLLDEVGLAENSPNNPLKVLHSILEPGKGELPDVAVVGISNWALDAAKMNRAIHLSRPEPTLKDLEETAISLCQDNIKSKRKLDDSTRNILNCLAKAYHDYQCKQGHANFHGLRDYYSLVKSLSTDRCHDMNQINVVLQRNFGGIPVESSKVQPIFMQNLKSHVTTSEKAVSIPVTTLIQENLVDSKARHLMLITNGDSAVGILKQNLPHSVNQIITIFGSRFEEDISDDYNYRMLSRIILCMERDCVLILRDLECIYGSLYDMLNQNYSVVGKRKNCRVALGAYSNPMCYVNDSFRCIVLVDQDEVNYADPPFLNRFEKQLLRFSDVLSERQREIIVELQLWVGQMSSVEGLDEHIKESDMFMGFHEDTLPSLVLLHSNNMNELNEDILIKKCKDDLMWIATPDGVLRTQKCEQLKENPREVEIFADEYFEKPIHNGLAFCIKYFLSDQEFSHSTGDEVGSKLLIMTYATVHTDISQCLDGSTITYQLERLGAYKSEKQLEDRVHNFLSSDKDLLVLQCTPELDGEHMLLARSVIEDKRRSYAKTFQELTSTKQKKHVCILVHVPRAVKERAVGWQLNFLSGWKQVFLDALDVPPISVNEIRNETIDSILTSSIWSFRRFAVECILWCFNCITYTQNPRQKESILKIAKNMFASKSVTTAIQKLVLQHVSAITDELSSEEGESWQVKVACDLELLHNSSTLTSAMEQYISSLIRQPLAKLVYFLERENAWPPHLFYPSHEHEYENEWCGLLLESSILNIKDIPKCLGADGYSISGSRLDLRVPFSQVIFHGVDAARDLIMKVYTQVTENDINFEDGVLTETAKLKQLQQYSEILRNLVPYLHKLPESFLCSYMADILEITSADFKNKIDNRQRILFTSCAFLSFAEQWLPIEDKDPLQFYALLHLFVWTSDDKLNNLLEILNLCQSLVQTKRLEKLAKDFFLEKQDILPFAENEPIDERIDEIRNRKSFESDSEESDSETSDSESNDSDEDDSHGMEKSDNDSSDSESSSSESETESIKSNEEEEGFEDMLVNLISENMFPSRTTVNENGGLESWIRNSSLFLSLVKKIGNQTPAYHFLGLCVNFAKMVVQETRISEEYLHVLNDVAKQLEPDYLDADSAFQNITEALIEPVEHHLRGQEENHAVLQRFISQFYCRCLETNVETESRRLIIEHVLSLHGEGVLIMTPVMYRLLFAEEAQSPGVFVDIVIDQSVDVNHSCLKVIDDVFNNHFGKSLIHHDSYPAVMICDLIHSIQDFSAHFKKEELKSSDSKLLKCFRCATNVVTGSEDNTGLVLLSSVAFLRAFYTMLSKQPSILNTKTAYSHVMGEINSLLAVGGARRSSMQIFFLKQLYAAGMTMFDISKLCCDSDQLLPVLKNHFEQCKIVTKAELISVYSLPEYDEVKAAYKRLTHGDDSEMVTILSKCKKSENYRLALLGTLTNMIYLKKAVSNLSDKEERLLRWFSENSKDLPSPLKELLMRIIGFKNFHHHGLQISLASSTSEIETALLILHISCVVASCVEDDTSALFQYFVNPEKCHGTCIPAHGKDRKRRVFDKFTLCHESSPVTCSCGLRLKHKRDQEQNLCPSCGTETVSDECEITSSERINIYCLEAKSKEWEKCTDNMDTYVYRALDLIVCACLYAGVATGISSDEDASLLLGLETEGSTSRTGKDNVADFCLNRIKEALKCLVIILSCKSRSAVNVMHLVVEKCTELIQGKIVDKGAFSTTEECKAWENKFIEVVEDILPNATGSASLLKEMLKDRNEERSSIEKEIQELDEYPFDSEQQNEELKRLFRLTKEPSFTEVRSIFLIFEDFHKKHSLLSVLFSKFDELPYLTCLYPLLHWSRLVSSALTHRISRKEAEFKNINDFIDGHVLQRERSIEEREELRKLFNDFRDAWNRMREFVNKNLDQDEMPYLTNEGFIGYCLTEGDLSIYLRTAIRILQAIQNNILDEMIITSVRTEHPALNFLQKSESCCAITSVTLQEAKDKDIINFDWCDRFLRYAQNADYGDGEQIDYDFEEMEIQLANEIGHGKCFLVDSLNPFIFSKELFHSSTKILEKIHEVCPQSHPLPDEIRQGIRSLKERRKQDARNLLQHIEIVIYLLNIKSISSEEAREVSLENFTELWKPKLPSPFPADLLPEPKASIKLTHIAALYEALEDLLADGTIEGLPSQFRKELTEETKGLVDSLVDSRNGSIKVKQFLAALRRFVFRYLSAEKFLPEPHTPLQSCLSEPSLWSPDQAPGSDVIPREITLENIYAVITHLQEVIISILI